MGRTFAPHLTSSPRDSIVRSLVKTLVYRAVSAASTVTLAWLVFGNLELAGAFGLVDLVANTTIYFLYERGWSRFDLWHRNGQSRKAARRIRWEPDLA